MSDEQITRFLVTDINTDEQHEWTCREWTGDDGELMRAFFSDDSSLAIETGPGRFSCNGESYFTLDPRIVEL